LLPGEITLVTANSRSNLASLIATSTGALVALGVDKVLGGGDAGAAWVLRFGTVIYLAAMLLALRLPDTVDVPAASAPSADAAQAEGTPSGNGVRPPADAFTAADGTPSAASYGGPGGTIPFTVPRAGFPGDPQSAGGAAGGVRPAGRRRFALPSVGPVVGEAMRANAAIRVFYGFLLFFLAFILKSEHFGHISQDVALGGLAAAIAVGGMLGTVIGSALRARAPRAMMFAVLALTTVASMACALMFGLWSVWAVAGAAAIAQTLVKAGLDSILQREIPDDRRSSTFAFSETLHQLALVGGGLLGLLFSLTGSGLAGLTFAAAGLLIALCLLLISRRRRILRTRPTAPSPAR
jgi:hypothetical protein